MTAADRRIGIVVLAAGGSVRLGQPKQLLPFRGSTLLHHAAATALEAGLGPVLVLLGAEAERCQEALKGLDVSVVVHPHWRDGMGSSIRTAVRSCDQTLEAVILMACDQPGVSAADLTRLAGAYRRRSAPMVASGYAGTAGIPALFDRSCFADLGALSGDQGAKALLARAGSALCTVACPAAAADVDQESDVVAIE